MPAEQEGRGRVNSDELRDEELDELEAQLRALTPHEKTRDWEEIRAEGEKLLARTGGEPIDILLGKRLGTFLWEQMARTVESTFDPEICPDGELDAPLDLARCFVEGLAELLPMYLAERDFAPALYALAQIHPELVEDLERGTTLEGRKALREKYANG